MPAVHAVVSLLKSRLPEILPRSVPCSFKSNQILFYERHLPHGLYISELGKVRLVSGRSEPRRWDRIDLAGHSILGLESLLAGEPYVSRAVAGVDTRVYFVSKAAFFSWIERGAC